MNPLAKVGMILIQKIKWLNDLHQCNPLRQASGSGPGSLLEAGKTAEIIRKYGALANLP